MAIKSIIFETNYFKGEESINSDQLADLICQESMNEFISSITKIIVNYDNCKKEEFTTDNW